MRIAIDTGGTFTDCVYFAEGQLRILKLPSTPSDPAAALLEAVRQVTGSAAAEVRHGTTVGTNALLERKGARVAFVTTAGFEDSIAIGRQNRPELYDLLYVPPPPLVPPELRFGVPERTNADGSIRQAFSSGTRFFVEAAPPEAIAISLLFSFANPANEIAVANELAGLGMPVSVSHRILPEFREYERASTVVINAYLAPKMQSYLGRLDPNLLVMQSSGGIIEASTAAQEPVRTILSGPAGGVVGSLEVAKRAGYPRVLTFDMGGTSTDVALIEVQKGLRTTTEARVVNMPVAVPMLNIHTVGAGGGSLASFDRGGALRVGPESAGADPGPVCYGRGTQPTVTDANLLLGRLHASGLLGGGMALDSERARLFADEAKGSLPSVEAFAEGIVRVVNAHMEQALRKISIEQGFDPREFVLLSFGGAGPLHACALARSLNIRTVLVPPLPGALSAYGILVSDNVRTYSRTVMMAPDDAALAGQFELLTPEGERFVDMRYKGQGFELTVPWTPDFVESFHQEHQHKYGYADRGRAVEVVNVRVRVTKPSEAIPVAAQTVRPGDGEQAVTTRRSIYEEGSWVEAKVFARDGLRAGDAFTGPAVINEYSATTYVPAGCGVSVDEWMNLVITIHG